MSKAEETSYECPECGGKIYKQFNTAEHYYHPIYHWFWCENFCNLTCANCESGRYNKDTCVSGCMNFSKWNPIKRMNFKQYVEQKVTYKKITTQSFSLRLSGGRDIYYNDFDPYDDDSEECYVCNLCGVIIKREENKSIDSMLKEHFEKIHKFVDG